MPTKRNLLSLPMEIKEQIYIYALTDDVHLTATYPVPRIPALTLACRQTFTESLGIFLQDTYFIFDVVDCNGAFTVKATARFLSLQTLHLSFLGLPAPTSKSEEPRTKTMACAMTGKPHFKNTLRWGIAVHQHGSTVFRNAPGQIPDADVLSSFLLTAETLKDLPWYRVHQVLKHMQTAVVATTNRKWA